MAIALPDVIPDGGGGNAAVLCNVADLSFAIFIKD